jgi:hypothetical protein
MTSKVKLKLKQLIKKKDFSGMTKMLSNYDKFYDIDNELFIYSIKVGNKETTKFFYDRIIEVTLEMKHNSYFVNNVEFMWEEFGDKLDFSMKDDLYRITDNEEYLSDEAKELFLF